MAKKAAAKTKKKAVAPPTTDSPQLHEREVTKIEASRLTNRDSLAAAYLVARDGMDEDTAKMVVGSMDADSIFALVEEALIAPAPTGPDESGAMLAEPYVDFTTVPELASDETFPAEVVEMVECASTKNAMEKRYKELKPIVAQKLKDSHTLRAQIGDIQLNCFPGKNKQLSKEKLMEKGVSTDVINQCYSETPYDDIRISRVK